MGAAPSGLGTGNSSLGGAASDAHRPTGGAGALLLGILMVALVGCAPAAAPTPSPAPATAPPLAAAAASPTAPSAGDGGVPPAPAVVPSPSTGTGGNTPVPSPEGADASGVTITVGDGSAARYLVREQLARLSLPNDAVGETSRVSGSIVFDGGGQVDSSRSVFTVDLTTLRSDEARRDRYLQTRSLESSIFPTAEFVVRQLPGLSWPLPSQGEHAFQMVGDLILRGVTRPVIWDVTAQFADGAVLGQARTSFTFDEFEMAQPSVSIVLSVDNNIRLELDFRGAVRRQPGT